MKKYTKLLAMLLALVMIFSIFAACAKEETPQTDEQPKAPVASNEPANNDTPVVTPDENNSDEAAEGTFVVDSESTFERKTPEGTLTIGTSTAISGFDPVTASSPASYALFDRLVEIDPETHELVGGLAERWEWSEDNLTCTFYLRDNVYCADGTQFTSYDAYYCLKRLADTAGQASAYLGTIDYEKSSYEDDLIFVMVMKHIYPQILYRISAFGNMYSAEFAETATSDDWWTNPAGTGPYALVEAVEGSHVSLVAREDYWKGPAEVKDVTFKYFSDSTAMFIAYQSGDIDMAQNILAEDAARIMNGEVDHTVLEIATGYDFKMLAMCDYVEAFQNENVRKAVAYAIDKQACVDVAYGVLGTVMDSSINDSAEFYTPIGVYDYDPEYAKELLAQEGYSDGDIVLRMITFNTTFDTLLAEAVQAYLDAVGIVVNLESYIAPTAIPMLRNGEADMTLTGTGGAAYEASIPLDKMLSTGTDKSTIIHDAELEALILAGGATMDKEARQEAYTAAQQMIFDKCYTVPIVNINQAYCYRTYIAEMPCVTAVLCNPWNCVFAD